MINTNIRLRLKTLAGYASELTQLCNYTLEDFGPCGIATLQHLDCALETIDEALRQELGHCVNDVREEIGCSQEESDECK